MPTLATGIWIADRPRQYARRYQGFTLIEVLVVLLVIGIVLGMAMLSMGRQEDPLRQDTRRLAALLGLAAEEAVLRGQELALEFVDDGYRFLTFDGEVWVTLQDSGPLRPRSLPAKTRVDLEVEGEQVILGDQADNASSSRDTPPARIYLLSSGRVTPFQLTLRRWQAEQGYRLQGGPSSEIEHVGQVEVY